MLWNIHLCYASWKALSPYKWKDHRDNCLILHRFSILRSLCLLSSTSSVSLFRRTALTFFIHVENFKIDMENRKAWVDKDLNGDCVRQLSDLSHMFTLDVDQECTILSLTCCFLSKSTEHKWNKLIQHLEQVGDNQPLAKWSGDGFTRERWRMIRWKSLRATADIAWHRMGRKTAKKGPKMLKRKHKGWKNRQNPPWATFPRRESNLKPPLPRMHTFLTWINNSPKQSSLALQVLVALQVPAALRMLASAMLRANGSLHELLRHTA